MRALRPYRVELARDYHLSLDEIEKWGLDDLVDLARDIARRCAGQEPAYEYKWR